MAAKTSTSRLAVAWNALRRGSDRMAGGRLPDLDETAALLESALAQLAPDDPNRGRAAGLALQRAARYVMPGGTGADREEALAFARMCLAVPADGEVDDVASTGHVVIAWMMLTRQFTTGQRAAMAMGGNAEAALSATQVADSRLPELGRFEITPADAAMAMTHLRQVPDSPGEVIWSDIVPPFWATALLAAAQADGFLLSADLAVDALRTADALSRVAAAADAPERGELLAMRAALLAVHTRASAAETVSTAGALTDAAAMLPTGHLLRSPLLHLVTQTLGRQATEGVSSDDVEARLAEVADLMDRMPHDDAAVVHAMTAVSLGLLSTAGSNRSVLQQDWLLSGFERLVSGLEPDDPMKPLAQYMHGTARLAQAILQHRPEAVDALIGELARYADSVPAGYIARPYMLTGLGVAYVDRHAMSGELSDLERADGFVARAFAEADPQGPFGDAGPLRGLMLYLRGHLRLVRCYYDPSLERVTAAIKDLERAVVLEPTHLEIASELQTARAMRDSALIQPEQQGMYLGADARKALDGLLETAKGISRDNPYYAALVSQAASGLVLRGLADRDITLIDQAIRILAEASNTEGLAVRERPHLLEAHGLGLLTRYSQTRVPGDLSNAIDRLEEARRAVEQEPGSPRTASVLQTLASAYRTRGNAARGDVDRAVAHGLAALREHAGDVFLQDNDENAVQVARRGTNDATEMARWFLQRGREEAAVSALELGRGMVLNAATTGAGVEQVLRESGHADLAARWAAQPSPQGQAGSGDESDLRYQVMLAIEQSAAEARLLSPPAVSDIAAALTATGTDALVYLLPRDDASPGLAVVVDPNGTVRRTPLPGLYLGGGSPVEAFLRTRRAAEAAEPGPVVGTARQAWLDVLGTLCDWAWRVAIGPLLNVVPARGTRAVRRIVLVPAGELGLVPWHAARQPDSGAHACQRMVFSYASSARQFVETARSRPQPWAQAPVLISDAAQSLYLTAAGVAHLHAAHYPAATVFGYARRWLAGTVAGTPAATRDDVLGALPRAGFPGASLLHFGCHGRVQVPVLGSSLMLRKDDEGKEVKVEVRDILRQARSRPAAETAAREGGGLIVLASCLSDVTEGDFDEALTLATAFISAGAAGVVAARWAVADSVASLFMNIFHQFLNGSHKHPAHALREAQLWMLNPDREVPAGWPRVLREEASLAGRPGGSDLASPEAWAGFTYQGW